MKFGNVTAVTGIVGFIRGVLIPSDWDQSKLVLDCQTCGKHQLRIAYDFPRSEDPVRLKVVHMAGPVEQNPYYLPMMWETKSSTDDNDNWFDFKYINGNSIWGLNKAAVFSRPGLRQLFQLYERKCGGGSFP